MSYLPKECRLRFAYILRDILHQVGFQLILVYHYSCGIAASQAIGERVNDIARQLHMTRDSFLSADSGRGDRSILRSIPYGHEILFHAFGNVNALRPKKLSIQVNPEPFFGIRVIAVFCQYDDLASINFYRFALISPFQ